MIDDRDPIRFRTGLPTPTVREVCAAILCACVVLPGAWILLALLLA